LFRIADSAVVDAQTFNFNDSGGITINAKNFEAVNGGQVISTSRSSGKAGNITINATNSIVLTGTDATFTDRLAQFGPVIVDNVSASSGLFANTLPESTGDGSSILVNSGQRIVITAGAGIAVNSEGLGNTGNVELKSPNITLDGNAYLSATTSSGDRGNIILQSGNIQLRRGSNITTNASNNANGGNIAIDTGTLVALEDSDIRANAIRGQGGNIQLTALGIFRAGESDIDASSQLGINGIVQISRLDDPSRGLVPFEVNLASETAAEFTGCTAGGASAEGSLYVTGNGGLPPNPGEALNSNPILDDLGSSAPPAIVEARTLIKTADGRLLLVAEIPNTCR